MLVSIPVLGLLYSYLPNIGAIDDSLPWTWMAVGGFINTASIIPYVFADYLSKADMPNPPKKTVWKRAGDFSKELFTAKQTDPLIIKYQVLEPNPR